MPGLAGGGARGAADRLLIETDSPYLAPMPYRGRTNEPSFVPKVAHKVAELKNVTVDEVAASTTNFFNLFRILSDKLAPQGSCLPVRQTTDKSERYRKDLKECQHSGAD